ncbi:MAG: hypothetical protein ONB05_12345, partial [candidate division KSB1 bacterium]|nr:hypothetical protein [candidate division KSB1 bacterium]
ALLRRIESGQVQLVVRQAKTPSPFTSSLLFDFMAGYMYEWDRPKPEARAAAGLDKDLLQELLHPEAIPELLAESVIKEVERRLQAEQEGYQARTPTELVELLRRIGDLTEEEIASRVSGNWKAMLTELSEERRAVNVFIAGVEHPWRWIAAEDFPLYRDAFVDPSAKENLPENYRQICGFVEKEVLPDELLSQKYDRTQAQRIILERYLRHHTLVTVEQILRRYPLKEAFVRELLTDLENQGNLVQIPATEESAPPRWAYQETVERIRRVTLAQQRRRVQPCDTAQFVDFLLRWQHRTPQTKLSGSEGVLTTIEQLQGLALPAEIWDSEIFGRRVQDYRPAWLDELCSRGHVVWYGSPGSSGDWGNIAFAFREDLAYFHSQRETSIDQQPEEEATARVKQVLAKRGASFVSDLALETGLPPSTCANALWEMIWRGEVTNDTLAVVRAGRPLAKDPRPYPYQQNARWVRQRVSGNLWTSGRYRPVAGSGRWSLLPQPQGGGEATIEILARQLLQRYGLICRELYSLEGWTIPWRLLYETLVRLEWRGEIRRGYFVKGFSGAQFALPQAADELMAYSQKKPGCLSPEDFSEQMLLINACDPVNLYGAASPLPLLHPLNPDWRFLRHPGNYLVLKNGLPVLAIEAKGSRLTPLRDLSAEEKREALSLLPQLLDDPGGLHRIRSLKVESWDGQPVRNSEIVEYLKEMGFRDEFKVMVLERGV